MIDRSGQGAPILQSCLAHPPWGDPALARLPGMRPVDGGWITVDDAYTAQMEERARLIATRGAAVHAICPEVDPILAEVRDTCLAALPAGFARVGNRVTRPDGATVPLDGPPLLALGRLLQEDLLVLEKRGDEHVLVAGLLCFPASWTLAEKIGRPLTRIHDPVEAYGAALARRVQRLFDRVVVGRPLWRANALGYASADLFQPRAEQAPRVPPGRPRYLRSERQTMVRLPVSGAVLFAVHTTVIPLSRLTPAQRIGCPVALDTDC
jgi:hypothetical protein